VEVKEFGQLADLYAALVDFWQQGAKLWHIWLV
jgi:hypothetical protein